MKIQGGYLKTVTILKGLPASGKSTWAKEQLDAAPTNSIKRVNKDLLRKMLDNSMHSKGNEKFVLSVRNAIIDLALNEGKHVIVDDTNLHPDHIRDISRNVRDRVDECQVKIKDFTDVSLDECIKRNEGRIGTEGYVPQMIIRSMHDKYLVDKPKVFVRKEHDPDKETVIMCDLDGTLALMGDRSPYDASTCADDEINTPVLSVITEMDNHSVVFLSGRSDKYRSQTLDFLKKCGFAPHKVDLFMRKEGDFRKDSIVKEELYRTHVEPVCNVEFVLDDRDQVVEMWRSIGLNCFQVAEGNF